MTLIVLFLPFVAALLLLLVKGESVKKIALGFALAELVLALMVLNQYMIDPKALSFTCFWITSLGAHLNIDVSGISMLLVLLTAVLIPLIILSTFKHDYKNPAAFYALILAMSGALIGVFVANDLLLFYVFWEAALIPIYFIAALWGGENRIKVTFKFFLYTVIGSLFMLIGVMYLYLQTNVPHPITFEPHHSFDFDHLVALNLSFQEQCWLFWAFFIAFAIKMPIFPFHTWQPDTYTEAPAAGTMLLSGIMLKMGVFGVLHWLMPIMNEGFYANAKIVITLAIIGVVYTSILAIMQKDMKRLIAYSSIAHVGLIAAGLFAVNEQSLQGAVIQMFAHGVNVVGLFFIIDIIESRTGTRDIASLGGIINKAPKLGVLFVIIMLGAVALPLTNGFPGEFLLLNGIFQYNAVLAAVAGLTIILGAVYMLKMYQNVMLGEVNALTEKFTDLTMTEFAVLVPIAAIVIITGIYPQYFLDLTQGDVDHLLKLVNTNIVTIK